MEHLHYKGGCGVRESTHIETFKRRAGLFVECCILIQDVFIDFWCCKFLVMLGILFIVIVLVYLLLFL